MITFEAWGARLFERVLKMKHLIVARASNENSSFQKLIAISVLDGDLSRRSSEHPELGETFWSCALKALSCIGHEL